MCLLQVSVGLPLAATTDVPSSFAPGDVWGTQLTQATVNSHAGSGAGYTGSRCRPAKATMHICRIGPGGTKYNSHQRQLVLNTTSEHLLLSVVGLLLYSKACRPPTTSILDLSCYDCNRGTSIVRLHLLLLTVLNRSWWVVSLSRPE
jgi:hypothetical protein